MYPYRQRAKSFLRKTLRFDPEGVIETRPVILPRNRGSQLDKLRLVEMCAERTEQFVWNFDGRQRHRHAVIEHQLLKL